MEHKFILMLLTLFSLNPFSDIFRLHENVQVKRVSSQTFRKANFRYREEICLRLEPLKNIPLYQVIDKIWIIFIRSIKLFAI